MTVAILTDLTRCVGCEACVQACREVNGLPADGPRDRLSATSWTAIDRSHGIPIRRQCMHCVDPACASACPVGALEKTALGPVVYAEDKCIGCRYCMVACPFSVPTYEWRSKTPLVRKCILCYENFTSKHQEPACTRVCPAGATVFGERDALIAEAKRRLAAEPKRYVPHVYGLEEAGGTSVLYLSAIPFDQLGFPPGVRSAAYPELTWNVLGHLPDVVSISGVTLAGLAWIIRRRNQLAAVEPTADTRPHHEEGGQS